MYRAIAFSTLTLLMLAVVGVSFAQESSSGRPDAGEKSPGSGRPLETTSLETTAEDTGVPETVPGDRETATTSLDRTGPESPAGESTGRTPEQSGLKKVGKPERGKKSENHGKPESPGKKPTSAGKSEKASKYGTAKGAQATESRADGTTREKAGGGQQKVTLCHKGKKTLTVGASAEEGHLRHGDSFGRCG